MDSVKIRLNVIAIFASWVSPVTVWKNDSSGDFSRWHILVAGLATKAWQLICAAYVFTTFDGYVDDLNYVLGRDFITGIIFIYFGTMIFFFIGIGFLQYLGNDYNVYQLSSRCCFCSGIVGRPLIFNYLENPVKYKDDMQEDHLFPGFFENFLQDLTLINKPGEVVFR